MSLSACGEETQYITSKLEFITIRVYNSHMVFIPGICIGWGIGNQQWMCSYCNTLYTTNEPIRFLHPQFIVAHKFVLHTFTRTGCVYPVRVWEWNYMQCHCSYFWDTACILWTQFTATLLLKLKRVLSLFHSAVPSLLFLHSFIVHALQLECGVPGILLRKVWNNEQCVYLFRWRGKCRFNTAACNR